LRAIPDRAATCRAGENQKFRRGGRAQGGVARKAIDYTEAQSEVVALNRARAS